MLAEQLPDEFWPNRKAVGTVIVPVRLPLDIVMVKFPEAVAAVLLGIEKVTLKAPVTSGMPGLNFTDPAVVREVGVPLMGPVMASMVMVVLVGDAACMPAQNNRVGTRNPDVRNMGPPLHLGQQWRRPLGFIKY
jgi:hypothetical protein